MQSRSISSANALISSCARLQHLLLKKCINSLAFIVTIIFVSQALEANETFFKDFTASKTHNYQYRLFAQTENEMVAYDREEATKAVQCIGIGIRSHGTIQYGLSVTTPSYRLTDDKQALIKEALSRAKSHMERGLA